MQKFLCLFLKIASHVTTSCLVMCGRLVLQEFFVRCVGKKEAESKADHQPPPTKVTSDSQIEI